MKKVVLTSFLACVVCVSGQPSAFAQDASAAAAQTTTTTAGGQVQMPAAEFAVYNSANTQTDPKARAAALEGYLTQFPQSAVKESVLGIILGLDFATDQTKALDVADRILQLDPTYVTALYVEVLVRKAQADALTDAAAKQAAMDTVAGYAQKGLVAPKPKDMSDADFEKVKAAQYPIYYSAIGYDAELKKDPTAIDDYKKELALVPLEVTKTPGSALQDIFYLAYAYYQQTPPDYLNCTFYASRSVAYAPEPYKTEFSKLAKYCYKKFHGADDGYDAVLAAATANLNPPDGFAASVKPAPTPADIVNNVMATTPDLATLATGDKEYILQNGTPDQAAKVWDTVKGKSFQFPGALVLVVSPTQLQVALSDDAVQAKTADFTFNLKASEEGKTSAEKAAAKKRDDAIAAIEVGQIVTLSGTFDSYTPKPLMIMMSDGDVVFPKAKAAAAPAHAAHPVHHHAH
jgi:hypothetical protein